MLAALEEAGEPLSVNEVITAAQLRNRNAADLLLGKMARDGEVERAGRGLYSIPVTAGQIGQTERLNVHGARVTNENGVLSNLSDLSKAGDGTETQEGTGASRSVRPPERSDDLAIPDFLRRPKTDA